MIKKLGGGLETASQMDEEFAIAIDRTISLTGPLGFILIEL
ncbi:hypothetical protein [Clostridium sp. DL-VIII]|nr:hypothetical protein [Clostridium sp. DL-VIII]